MVDVVTNTGNQLLLSENPAFLAWKELDQGNIVPERIEILKGNMNPHPQKTKGLVCLLVGVGPDKSSVIGKRCRRTSGMNENLIYEEILPNLPFPSLNYYGKIEEEDSEYLWLFLEYAGNIEFTDNLAQHRLLATEWLALMHTSSIELRTTNRLPIKGTKYYLKRLQSGREGIRELLVAVTLETGGYATLRAIIDQCDLLERNWNKVEEISAELPKTLIHGDFKKGNLRIRNNRSEMILLPFDWEEAGWGSPATDIMHIETKSYWCLVRDFWPSITQQTIQQATQIGKIFRSINAINWELPFFSFSYLERPIRRMGYYQAWFDDAIKVLGLAD